MRTILGLCAVAGLLSAIAPAADAAPSYGYVNDCEFQAASNVYAFDVAAVAWNNTANTPAAVSISVDCVARYYYGSEIVVLSASGIGVAAAGTVQKMSPGFVLCTRVSVATQYYQTC